MADLYVYRGSEYDSPEEAYADGALYETDLSNNFSIEYESILFRDLLHTVEVVAGLVEECIGGNPNIVCKVKHPQTGAYLDPSTLAEWSYDYENGKA